MEKMEIEILGSGTSMGVPMVGCDCKTCTSTNPKDKRLRTSCYFKIGDTQLLIDTSVDYRQQMLRSGIKKLDAIIYTHHHVDHVLGLDDLRSFNLLHKMHLPLYAMPETIRNIKRVFAYAFSEQAYVSGVPRLAIHEISDQPFKINGIEIIPIPLFHGKLPVMGFRIGDFAYCTDVSKIPDASYNRLKELKILILDALREKPHPTHFSIDEAVREAQKIGAEETYFTHISHQVFHEEVEAKLPEGIHLGYDGLKFVL